MDCIFCKIIAKEIPSDIVYEDDKVFAFLDIKPVNPGHTLVLPKRHSQTLLEATDEDLAALTSAVKKLVPAIRAATAAVGWNLIVNNGKGAGQLVDHTHWHIVPRRADDGLKGWPQHPYPEGEGARVAAAIRNALS